MKAVEIPGKGGPRVILQVRELYLILPSDGLLPKLATPQKSKETHQEHSRRPIEVAQAQALDLLCFKDKDVVPTRCRSIH